MNAAAGQTIDNFGIGYVDFDNMVYAHLGCSKGISLGDGAGKTIK